MVSRRGLIWAGGAAIATVAAIAAAFVVVMIVQGGDDSDDLFADITVPENRVTCEAFLRVNSFRFKAETHFFLEAREPGMDDTDGYREAEFDYAQIVDGAYDHGRYDVVITALPDSPAQSPAPVIVAGDMVYTLLADTWQARPLAEVGYFPVPYLPKDTCTAIAPDVFLEEATSVPEALNGVAAHKYHFDELTTDLPDRHPSFGPQSDAARLVNTYTGDIWVADSGGYIVKIDLTGIGAHPNGRELTVDIFYELSAVNDASIRIEPPV